MVPGEEAVVRGAQRVAPVAGLAGSYRPTYAVEMSPQSKSEGFAVVLTGAGMSAESGLRTFRGSDGLWEGHRVEDVATPEAWARDPEGVLRFYNERRRQVVEAEPNAGHMALAAWAGRRPVAMITQNVDDLHERAGSREVLHLHGEIRKVRSSLDERLLYEWEGDLGLGDCCERGSQLRPHVVWFGEAVPAMEEAAGIVRRADLLVVVGTSLAVYPAAGLVHEAPRACRKVWINPEGAGDLSLRGWEWVRGTAAETLPAWIRREG